MALAQSLVGLFGIALLFGRVAFALGSGRRAFAFAGAAGVLVLVPVGALSVAGYVRGVTGDLSVTTLVVLAVGFAGGVEPRERRTMSILVVLGALWLYPMALGLGSYDPYRLGFAPSAVLLVTLALVAAAAWLRQLHVLVMCIALAVASHALELLESANLWDYLIDPWLVLASIYDLRFLRRTSSSL